MLRCSLIARATAGSIARPPMTRIVSIAEVISAGRSRVSPSIRSVPTVSPSKTTGTVASIERLRRIAASGQTVSGPAMTRSPASCSVAPTSASGAPSRVSTPAKVMPGMRPIARIAW